MEFMSKRSNRTGFETTRPVPMTLERVLGYVVAFGLTLLGFCIMLAFSGPLYIEPQFQHTAQMILGLGVLCMLGGCRVVAWLSFEGGNARQKHDMRIIKLLCTLGVALGILMIVIGAWGYFIS